MGKFKTKSASGQNDLSDNVSELSHDDSASITSNMSKSSAFRFRKFGTKSKKGKKKGSDTTSSVGSGTKASRAAGDGGTSKSTTASAADGRPPPSPGGRGDARSVGSASAASRRKASAQSDPKRLAKDAKSRFNIGLVYLKTGDYAKAQENLEHSLYCHIQLSGHDAKAYPNDTLFAIASVRDKLGDCYVENTAIVDKCLALDHYEESRRLLKVVALEDAPDNVKELLERVEEKLKMPELRNAGSRKNQTVAHHETSRFTMDGNAKAKALLGVGAAAGAAGGAAAGTTRTAHRPSSAGKNNGRVKHKTIAKGLEAFDKVDVLGVGKGIKGIGKVTHAAFDKISDAIEDVIDDSSDSSRSSRRSGHRDDLEGFDTAISHLERDNHRTALNYLTSMQEGGLMQDDLFRTMMADTLMTVADSALNAGKISVATDAYEDAYAVLKQDKDAGEMMEKATKGCIKGHKLSAMEMEDVRDYGSAINHRTRTYELLNDENRCVPASQQLMKCAYLHAMCGDYDKSAVTLSDAIRRIFKGVKSLDMMPADRLDLLIQCYQMRAICYAKSRKLNDALEQYNDLLPLLEKKGGKGSKQYNSALIHKSALLVNMGNHRLAAGLMNKYMQLAELHGEKSDGNNRRASLGRQSSGDSNDFIVDDSDHILALDTCAATHLKLGNVDKAISMFEKKLEFVKSHPGNDEMKSDTLHKLGCLLAYKQQHTSALPLLTEALSTSKVLYDGRHKSVFDATWAVAATNQTLGDTEKALKDYSILLEKMSKMDEMPDRAIGIQNSAGKLFLEDGKVDKAIQTFRQALRGAETSGNPILKAEITLNLANALSARGEADKAMQYYDSLLKTRGLKKTKMFFLTLYNKSYLLVKTGEIEEGKEILLKVAETRSALANDVRGTIYLTLGNLSVSDGNINEAMEYYENSLDVIEEDDVSAHAQAKKNIGMAYLAANQYDEAISTLEGVLEDLSETGVEGKSMNILKAEIWNCLARVYKTKGDLSQAKNFAKLALHTYKTELGETHPITLRNISNLQLLLLLEAEDLPKSEAKPIIDAAKYELEETLNVFVALNDPWTYRLDVASLKTNLALVSVWQGKPKKARKLLRQINEIELPPDHSLVQRIEVLEERLEELEKRKSK